MAYNACKNPKRRKVAKLHDVANSPFDREPALVVDWLEVAADAADVEISVGEEPLVKLEPHSVLSTLTTPFFSLARRGF